MNAPGGLTIESVMAEHSRFVRRTLTLLRVHARHLDDVEQEVWRGVAKGLATFDGVNLKGWIFGICERQVACHRRQEIRRAEVLPGDDAFEDEAASGGSVEEKVAEAERRALLFELLADLEPGRRAVVIAYELEGVPMREIADELGIPVNTAWNRLRLAREDLRAALRRRGGG